MTDFEEVEFVSGELEILDENFVSLRIRETAYV